MPVDIPFHRYDRMPQLRAELCMALVLTLSEARPGDMTAAEQAALDALFAAGTAVERILDERDRARSRRVRPRLDAFIAAWTCCSDVLDAYARLDVPFTARARALRELGFTQRHTLLSCPAPELVGEAMRRYRRVTTESSRDELVAVVGEDLVRLVETTMKALADVLGCGDVPKVAAEAGVLARRIRDVQAAVVAYARALGGSVALGDAASVERFRRAVAPIDELRRSRAQRSAKAASRAARAADATVETTGR
jgi:hypothetical protein